MFILQKVSGTSVFGGKKNKQRRRVRTSATFSTFTFTDPVQPLPLHFVFVSQGHCVKHSTAQDGTARLGRVPPLLLSHEKLTRFRILVHCQHYSPGHTASAHTPARKTKKNLVKHNARAHTHKPRIHTILMYKKTVTWEGIKESLTTKSLSLLLTKSPGSCRR